MGTDPRKRRIAGGRTRGEEPLEVLWADQAQARAAAEAARLEQLGSSDPSPAPRQATGRRSPTGGSSDPVGDRARAQEAAEARALWASAQSEAETAHRIALEASDEEPAVDNPWMRTAAESLAATSSAALGAAEESLRWSWAFQQAWTERLLAVFADACESAAALAQVSSRLTDPTSWWPCPPAHTRDARGQRAG